MKDTKLISTCSNTKVAFFVILPHPTSLVPSTLSPLPYPQCQHHHQISKQKQQTQERKPQMCLQHS